MSFYKEVPGRQTTLESTLKFDTTPTAGSTNPVTSGAVKEVEEKADAAAEALQEQIDDIAEKAGSGYTPKGEATVSTLNGLSGQENGDLYTMTDAGTLTDGSLAVVAGDTVAWDATNSVWYKAMDYAPRQYGTNEVHNLPTTITAFRTGDYIAVDGPSGTAKMSKDDLLKETAENALGSIRSLSDTATEADLKAGNYFALDGVEGTNKLPAELVAKRSVQDKDDAVAGDWNFAHKVTSTTRTSLDVAIESGEKYVIWRSSSGFTKFFLWTEDEQNSQTIQFGDSDFVIFTANRNYTKCQASSLDTLGGSIIIGKTSLLAEITFLASKNSDSIKRDENILGVWNFAQYISEYADYFMDKAMVQGKEYLVWRSDNNLTKIYLMEEGGNAQVVEFGDNDYLFVVANGPKIKIRPNSTDTLDGVILIAEVSIIKDAFKQIDNLKQEEVKDIVFDVVCPYTGRANYYTGLSISANTKYVIETDPSKIDKFYFGDSETLIRVDVSERLTEISFDSAKTRLFVYNTSEVNVILHDLSEVTNWTNRFEIDKLIKNDNLDSVQKFSLSVPSGNYSRVDYTCSVGTTLAFKVDRTKASMIYLFNTGGVIFDSVYFTSSDYACITALQDVGYIFVRNTDEVDFYIQDATQVSTFTNRALIEDTREEVYYVGTGHPVTSFTQMLLNLQNNTHKKVIYIEQGVYDIFEEIGGAEYASNLGGTDNDWRSHSVFVPNNTRIVGIGDVVFNFLPNADEISDAGASQLSPLNIDKNVSVENITINADNCRYCIHSETSGLSANDGKHQVYKNVILNKAHTAKGWRQAFGCGFNKRAKFDFDGCIFKSYDQPISFHDRLFDQYDGATINIKNCIFETSSASQVYALNFNESSVTQTQHHVMISNTRVNQPVRINKGPGDSVIHNSYDVRAIGCGNLSFSVDTAFTDNIYPPQDYS